MRLRGLARRWVPYEARLAVRVARRRLADRRENVAFAAQKSDRGQWPFELCTYDRPFIDYPGQEALGAAKRRNQSLLASFLDGTIVEPGETFSAWHLAPRPTRRLGYQQAAALKEGELTTDIGGAICLLSTVLYNVALLGGLRVTERHCHSVDSYGERRYFELGRDAAIEYGYRDLRFVNVLSVPVLLAIDVTETSVSAALRVPSPVGLRVRLEVTEPDTLEPPPPVATVDSLLPRGTEVVVSAPLPGLRLRTYRITSHDDGHEVREDLGETLHVPRPGMVRRGLR